MIFSEINNKIRLVSNCTKVDCMNRMSNRFPQNTVINKGNASDTTFVFDSCKNKLIKLFDSWDLRE